MMYSELVELVRMSNAAGNRFDYVQAGGGNTSVKFEDGYMAIKASGYFLKDMTTEIGFVAVNGAEIKRYHEEADNAAHDHNKEAMELAISSIKQINNEKAARPSVETGFHSILGKYVLHLHPVYANVLMCSKGGVEKATEIARAAGMSCIAVPYTMPGYDLTKLILEALDTYSRNNADIPQVIFLKNHGVVTHAGTAGQAMELMDNVNNAIISALSLPAFPAPMIIKDEDKYKSANQWMKKVLSESDIASQLYLKPVYPDQLVYTANEMSIGAGKGKINITNKDILYNTSEKEALALEETMSALVYLYDCIQDNGLELEVLSPADCAKILGWDSEKYRKSILA